MIYIGIDPGKDGALSALLCGPEGNILDVEIVPFDETAYRDRLSALSNVPGGCVCCLERIWTMPGQGHKSQGALMENFGFIRGLLTALSVPYELVTPQKWKREFQVTGDKNSSIAVCKRLFPAYSLRRTAGCRKDHDGMAEALLMAEYARRRL